MELKRLETLFFLRFNNKNTYSCSSVAKIDTNTYVVEAVCKKIGGL